MSAIQAVRLSAIDPNPMRKLKEYPFNEKKIEAIMRSIDDVGLWEGVIARKQGNRVELAFGHHRVEAARRQLGKNAEIKVIVRDLTDEQLIQFMGRENLEDYNADFLVMLESWQAADEFLRRRAGENTQDIEIARLLGWSRLHGGQRGGHQMMTDTGDACANSSRLIRGGYIKRDQLAGLSVRAVREICGRVVAQHEMLEKMAKTTGRPAKEIEEAKKVSGKAGERTARDVRAGSVAQRDIRGAVDTHAYRHAREAKKQTPLFAMFGNSLIEQIRRCMKNDSIGEKLEEVKKALGHIVDPDDMRIVKGIAFECEGVAERAERWHRAFSNPKTKVVPLKAITKE